MSTNIFVYADDIVLLCPSWHAMQALLLCVDWQTCETICWTRSSRL